MTFVRDMKSLELIEHMRELQKMPGWHDPLADSLFREIEDTEARRQSLWNACSEWAEKTDWARPFEAKELGKHICDVIKDRFYALKTENEVLRTDLAKWQKAAVAREHILLKVDEDYLKAMELALPHLSDGPLKDQVQSAIGAMKYRKVEVPQ